MRTGSCILIFILFCCQHYYCFGQTKSELERQRSQAQEIIRNTTRLLEEAGRTRQSSLQRLNLIQTRLEQRTNIISTIESEVKYLDHSLENARERINSLEDELDEARESYARMIKIAYRHRHSYQNIIFILSAEDFNKAYRRLKYLQQYRQSRKRQIERIETVKKSIFDEISGMERLREEKIALLEERRKETNLLSVERRQQNNVLDDLKRREDQLRSELAQQQRTAQAIERAIEDMLRAESRIAAEKRITELSPEDRIISENFKNSKGGLPWPTERGVVTGYFGENPHPVLRGIKVQNNGIDITTDENAEVRALFDGRVRQVLTVPGANNVIIVRHGNFLTVYANLSHVYVRNGDNVSTGQLIGRVFADSDEGNQSILHLEIWEENIKLDPMLWLSRQ